MCSTPTTIGSTIWSSRCVSQLGLPILISLLSLLSFVSLQSARVSQAVYSVPWYEGGTHFRKTLLIFLMQTQMPLVVSLCHRRGAQGGELVTSFQLWHAFHLADSNPAFMYALHFISRFGLFRSACR